MKYTWKLFVLFYLILLIGCSDKKTEPQYFLHMNCCYQVPVGLKIESNEVVVLSIEDNNGRKRVLSQRTFGLTHLSENIVEFHINDDSSIPNTGTYKYSDLNGVWELRMGMLESKESSGHYFTSENSVLFIE